MEKIKHIKPKPYTPISTNFVVSVQNETPEFKSILTLVLF